MDMVLQIMKKFLYVLGAAIIAYMWMAIFYSLVNYLIV
jgi:hypothetical protein